MEQARNLPQSCRTIVAQVARKHRQTINTAMLKSMKRTTTDLTLFDQDSQAAVKSKLHESGGRKAIGSKAK